MSHGSESMIGGEGHIAKMMGGGGQEGGGAADVTLLGGFKGEIEAVQGGGGPKPRVSFSETVDALAAATAAPPPVPTTPAAKSPVVVTTPATKAAVATPPAGPVQLELYEPHNDPNEIVNIDKFVTEIKISNYINKYNKLSKIFFENQYKKLSTKSTVEPTNINGINKASNKLIEEITAETIVVVPPIKGDLYSFITVLQYLLEQKLLTLNKTKFILNSKAVMIFMPPFFSTEKPRELFLQFLHLYETNLKSIFILHDSNDALNKTIGDELVKEVNYNGITPVKPLLNYANPTYIFHKGKKLLFSGVKELPGLGPNGAGENPVYKEYTVFGPEGTQLPAPKTSINCKGLTSLYYSDTLKEKKYIYDTPGTLLVIRTKAQQAPLFCFGSSVTLPIPGGFQGSEEAVGGDNTIEIDIAGNLFYIRKSINNIPEQWKQKIYTQSEADFLTYLNLSPEVLTVIFGTKWPEKIAGLFQNLSETNCRTADGRKLSTDCDITRKFIQDVFQYVYTHYEYRDGGETQPRIYIADDGGTVVWPSAQDLSEIPQSRFSQTDNMIVIHKKSGKHKFYKFNGTLTDAEKGSKLKELKTKYSKFDFLYWNIDNKLEVTPSEKAAIASVLSFYSRGM